MRGPVKILTGIAVSRLAEEAAARLADHAEAAVEEVVRYRGDAIARGIEIERLVHRGSSAEELAARIARRRVIVATAAGAITAAPAAAPGIGSATALAAGVADAIALIYTDLTLALSIASIYGRDLSDVEGRHLDVLLIMALEGGFAKIKNGRIVIDGRVVEPGTLPREALERITRDLGEKIIARVARRRVAIMLGREVPVFGIAVGAGANYRSVRRVAREAVRYFQEVPDRPRTPAASSALVGA